jgi:hypothetical protein
MGFRASHRGLLFATAAIVCGLGYAGPALAGDDGEAPLWRSLGNTLGVIDTDKVDENIKYGERAKLVLPKSNDLPPPAASVGMTADWPHDPDVEKVKRERAEKAQHENRSPSYDNAHLVGKPLSPDLLRSDHAGAGTLGKGDPCTVDPRNCHWIGAGLLEKLGIKKSDDAVIAGTEPDREWLTDPPQGYRKANASTKATFDAQPHIDAGDPRNELFKPPDEH